MRILQWFTWKVNLLYIQRRDRCYDYYTGTTRPAVWLSHLKGELLIHRTTRLTKTIIQERQDRQYDYHTYKVSLLYSKQQDWLRLFYRNDKTGGMTITWKVSLLYITRLAVWLSHLKGQSIGTTRPAVWLSHLWSKSVIHWTARPTKTTIQERQDRQYDYWKVSFLYIEQQDRC